MADSKNKLKRKIKRLKARHIPSYSRGLKRIFRESFGKVDNLNPVLDAAIKILDSYYSAEVISYIAARGTLEGKKEYRKYFRLALKKAGEVPQEWRRAEILEVIAKRMRRAGEKNLGRLFDLVAEIESPRHYYAPMKQVIKAYFSAGKVDEAFEKIKKLEGNRRIKALKIASKLGIEHGMGVEGIISRIARTEDAAKILLYLRGLELKPADKSVVDEALKELKVELPSEKGIANVRPRRERIKARAAETRPAQEGVPRVPELKGMERFSLGLYNTYHGSLHAVHTRTVARAAPLCYAYGMKLVLFGFPFENEEEAVDRVSAETNIGKGGTYLKLLKEEGRLIVLPYPDNNILPEVGELIATTSKPGEKKRVDIEKIVEQESRACLVMGLGRKGLPKRFLKMVEKHVELTGYGIPLETCTVMGVICERLKSLVLG
jgi:hypothetical protein